MTTSTIPDLTRWYCGNLDCELICETKDRKTATEFDCPRCGEPLNVVVTNGYLRWREERGLPSLKAEVEGG